MAARRPRRIMVLTTSFCSSLGRPLIQLARTTRSAPLGVGVVQRARVGLERAVDVPQAEVRDAAAERLGRVDQPKGRRPQGAHGGDRRCLVKTSRLEGDLACARSCSISWASRSRSSCCSPSAPTPSEQTYRPRRRPGGGRIAWPARRGRMPPAPVRGLPRSAPTASPTIILESGAFGTSADWGWMLRDLSAGGTGVRLRPGGPGPFGCERPRRRGGGPGSSELGRVLDQIGETGRVILIGHSNGALYAEAFARLHPERVAGLVYVNGVTSNARDDPRLIADLEAERRMANASVTVARLGLAPLVADKLVADSDAPADAAAAKRRALTCHACLVVARDEDRAIVPGPGGRRPPSTARRSALSRPWFTTPRRWASTPRARPAPGPRPSAAVRSRCCRASGRRPCGRRAAAG